MKAVCIILICVLLPFGIAAQEPAEGVSGDEEYLNGMVPVSSFTPESAVLPDSLSLNAGDCVGNTAGYSRSYDWLGGYGTRNLHAGINASVDLSAFTSFGKHHFSGTAERIDLMYGAQLNDKLSVAAGGYFENFNTNMGSYRAAGIAAMLDYRFNEHWEAYVYAQKNILYNASGSRFGMWNGLNAYDYYGNFADRIGLGLRYNFNNCTFLEVQFDFERSPGDFHQNLVNRRQFPSADVK